ncbi:MAG: cell division protein SepF [Candidatus Bathyarchaeota archaeon]|nr:cell division protein SepF [Candidatus Bathyarchaeota archaeon]
MPYLGIFRKPKKEDEPPMEEKPEAAPSETVENKDETSKTYLKAMPLKDLADLEAIKAEINNGNILILRITPLANKSLEDVKKAVNDLYEFAESINGDIARLGEERIVLCPPKIRIWREKTPVKNEAVPTAA